jgi:hypothetical protein
VPARGLGLDYVPLSILSLQNILDDHAEILVVVLQAEIDVRERLIAGNGYLFGVLIHDVHIHTRLNQVPLDTRADSRFIGRSIVLAFATAGYHEQ